jgi:putative transposase
LSTNKRVVLVLVVAAAAVAVLCRRGQFPTEQAAMKMLYLTVRERRPNRSNPAGRIIGWKAIQNTRAMTYGDRLTIN